MVVNTNGPVRGLIGRWVMRFEAAGQILSMTFQGTTAVSALAGVLAYTGRQVLVPYVLVAGVAAVFVFAFLYVEWGIYNRKNREGSDRGNNFAVPRDIIDDTLIATGMFAAREGRPPTDEESEMIEQAVREKWESFRNGVDL